MISQPKFKLDSDAQRIWVRFPLGPHGEVNHFLDALLMRLQENDQEALTIFCGLLKSRERITKNELVTYCEMREVTKFLDMISYFVKVSDPYDEAKDEAKSNASKGKVSRHSSVPQNSVRSRIPLRSAGNLSHVMTELKPEADK